jgi:hypothetical protein
MSKAVRDKMRSTRMKEIAQIDWKEEGIEIFPINEYQLRFVKHGYKLDYYPMSGKYLDHQTGHWGQMMVAEILLYLETP